MGDLRAILVQRNEALYCDVDLLLGLLEKAQVPPEAALYQEHVLRACREEIRNGLDKNLRYLRLGQDEVLEDVLSQTSNLTQFIHYFIPKLVAPVLRASSSDRLCLTIIGWMHREHPQTVVYPPALVDGTVSIWPFVSFAPIYMFPTVEQRGLLYQPLLFHEFGHLLYNLHKREMDDLVTELRQGIADTLVPLSRRNDRHSEQQAAARQRVVDTWYSWAQELFCDAVGFTIGGPCFLQAFSSYLGSMDSRDFYRAPEYLTLSTHPITWLRIRFLAERAEEAGYGDLAAEIHAEWRRVAGALKVIEDYHGYYQESLARLVRRIVDDMLVETAPREVTPAEAQGGGWCPDKDSPARLLNWAWQVYQADPRQYSKWEAHQVALLLQDTN
jgi:hypothetical protein